MFSSPMMFMEAFNSRFAASHWYLRIPWTDGCCDLRIFFVNSPGAPVTAMTYMAVVECFHMSSTPLAPKTDRWRANGASSFGTSPWPAHKATLDASPGCGSRRSTQRSRAWSKRFPLCVRCPLRTYANVAPFEKGPVEPVVFPGATSIGKKSHAGKEAESFRIV